MTKTARLNQSLEAFLFRRGFVKPEVRQLMRNQLLLAGGTGLLVLAASGASAWGLAYLAGAVLVTLNFWALARVAPVLVKVEKGAVLPLMIQFYGRLILTGLCLFVLIVWLNLPVVPLLAGLTTVVVNALSWGMWRYAGQKVKEA